MKHVTTFLIIFLVNTLLYGNHILTSSNQNEMYAAENKDGNNLVGTSWIYKDGNNSGIFIYFVSENWVKLFVFEKNQNRQNERDKHYILKEEWLCTYTMNNTKSGEIWMADSNKENM